MYNKRDILTPQDCSAGTLMSLKCSENVAKYSELRGIAWNHSEQLGSHFKLLADTRNTHFNLVPICNGNLFNLNSMFLSSLYPFLGILNYGSRSKLIQPGAALNGSGWRQFSNRQRHEKWISEL